MCTIYLTAMYIQRPPGATDRTAVPSWWKTQCKQCVMPPHDIVASLYEFSHIFNPIFLGEPGAIDEYRENNRDLLDSLDMPDLEVWLHL